MERLDPSLGDFVEWENLTERDREFYRLSVAALIADTDLLRRASIFAHDNVVGGGVEKTEKLD